MNRKTVIGICSLVAVIAAITFGYTRSATPVVDESTKAAAKEKDEQTQRLVRDAQTRIDTCVEYANRFRHGENSHLLEARRALARFAEDPEKNSIEWVDREIRDAYVMARRPMVVAELQQTLAEQSAYLAHVVERNDHINALGWTHLKQAEEFLKQYATGGHEGLPILVRQESAYLKQLMEEGVATATTTVIAAFDELLAVEKIGGEPKPNLRLYAHTRQARRFYDAFVKSSATNQKLLTLARAECMYARNLSANPTYVIPPIPDGKDGVTIGTGYLRAKDYELVAPFLQAVDSLVKKIEIVEESFPENKKATEALSKVRKTLDWVVTQMTERRSFPEYYWVQDTLRDADAVIEKLREEAGPRKLEAPPEADFRAWLEQYILSLIHI